MDETARWLRADLWEHFNQLESAQVKGFPPPLPEKPCPPDGVLVPLVAPHEFTCGDLPVREAIARRRSERAYTSEPFSFEELSYLLWATQGVTRSIKDYGVLRTVPSAGSRHPFETYVLANNIHQLEPGLYRYLGLSHQLLTLSTHPAIADRIHAASYEQYALDSAATFIWTAIPYRTAWRYGDLSPKLIAIDAGHVCQNLYLACVSLGAGACAVGAYSQELMDAALGVDGEHEFTIYMATTGKIK